MTPFQEFVEKLPHGSYKTFRDAILRRLTPRVTDQSFRNWERGLYEPDDTRRDAINAIAIDVVGSPIYIDLKPQNHDKPQNETTA